MFCCNEFGIRTRVADFRDNRLRGRSVYLALLLVPWFLAPSWAGTRAKERNASVSQEHLVGVVVDGGVVCALLRTVQGQEIALQGIGRDQYPPGTQLRLLGHYVRYSVCRQGEKTFQVERVLKEEAQK